MAEDAGSGLPAPPGADRGGRARAGDGARGLALAHQLAMRLELDRKINRRLHLLKVHLPCHESDHVLALAYSLLAGGRDLEDLQDLQHSAALKNLVGACRLGAPPI